MSSSKNNFLCRSPFGKSYTKVVKSKYLLIDIKMSETPKQIYSKLNECSYKDAHFDTWIHKYLVNKLLLDIIRDLQTRALEHDNSKLTNPVEVDGYGRVGPLLTISQSGSPEFEAHKKEMQPAIDAHMQSLGARDGTCDCENRHHVESHANGLQDMNLIDLLEMLADWKAAGARQESSSIEKSIEMMCKRYNASEEMVRLLRNTAEYLKY